LGVHGQSNMPIRIRKCHLLLCVTILLVATTGTTLRAEPVPLDDGWRRTAHGWERLVDKNGRTPKSAPVLVSPSKSPPSPLFHPLLLAAMQVGLVAAAYRRFPVKA
jgi:hypothetical protein